MTGHCATMPMYTCNTANFYSCKDDKFQMKKKNHVLAQNIDCGYSLEPQLSFRAKIRKNVFPCKLQFSILTHVMARVINRHIQGVKTIRPVVTRCAKQCNYYNDTCLIKVVIVKLNGRFINDMITRWHLIKNVLKNVFVLITHANNE